MHWVDNVAHPVKAQVGYSAILFYGYVGVIGLLLFMVLKWAFKSDIGLAQVWCTYGELDTPASPTERL